MLLLAGCLIVAQAILISAQTLINDTAFDVFIGGPVPVNWPVLFAALPPQNVDSANFSYTWIFSPTPGATPIELSCTTGGIPNQNPCTGRVIEYTFTEPGVYATECLIKHITSDTPLPAVRKTINITNEYEGPLVQRREFRDLSEAQWAKFVLAITELKAMGAWDHLSLIHAMTFLVTSKSDARPNAPNPRSAAHASPAFLTWHRTYLRIVERLMQVILKDDSFYMPYWDWTLDSAAEKIVYPTEHINAVFLNSFRNSSKSPLPLFTDQYVGPNGDPTRNLSVSSGPFCGNGAPTCSAHYTIPKRFGIGNRVTRRLGGLGQLPTRQQVLAVINVTSFDSAPYGSTWTGRYATNRESSFRGALEGWVGGRFGNMHNDVHRWIGGTMMNVQYSIEDPVFLLHHCNVDRIFWVWQEVQKCFNTTCYRPRGSDLTADIPGVVATRTGFELSGHMLSHTMSPWRITHADIWTGLPEQYTYLKPGQNPPMAVQSSEEPTSSRNENKSKTKATTITSSTTWPRPRANLLTIIFCAMLSLLFKLSI